MQLTRTVSRKVLKVQNPTGKKAGVSVKAALLDIEDCSVDSEPPGHAVLFLDMGEVIDILTRPHHVSPTGALFLRQAYTKANCKSDYDQKHEGDNECQSLPSSSFSYLRVISRASCALSAVSNRSTSPNVDAVTELSRVFLTLP